MLSKLTIAGLNEFTDGHIFDELTLPDGIDKDIVISEIIRQCSEFSVLYTEPIFLSKMIGSWSLKWYHNFERWYAAYTEEYNALYNVDVTSNITEHGINEEESATEGSVASTNSRNGSGTSSGNSSNNHSKAAFDASTPQPTEADSGTTSLSTSETGSESGSTSSSESMTASQEHTITTDERKYGNQGVTMSQEMLLAEFNAWRFNLYSQIADIFASEFCVCIYV